MNPEHPFGTGAPAARGVTSSSPPVEVNKWLVALSVTTGTLMGAIDSSIVNVALPHIQGTVGATIEQITWVATGYVVATVIVMPLTAWLGAMFGQKRVYMFCLALFLLGSALCGTARTLPSLVLWRVAQGLGAGALQPTEQAILRTTFPPEEQGLAMALFGVAVMVGPAVGPVLGGYITDNFSWPWIFYVNIPVGLAGLAMVQAFVHEPEDLRRATLARRGEARKNLDWQGIALMAVGLGALQTLLEQGQQDGWWQSPFIVALAFVAGVSLVAFVIRELSAPAPAVRLDVLKDPVFTSGTVLGGVMFACLMTVMFLLSLFVQELVGFTALQSGLLNLPRTAVMFVVTPIIGLLFNKVDPRLFVLGGLLAFAASTVPMSHYSLQTSWWGFGVISAIQGLGFAALFVPLTTLALATIPRARMADATGLNSLIRQVGGSVGLALFANQLSIDQLRTHADLSSHLTATSPLVQQRLALVQRGLMARGMDAYSARHASLAALAGSTALQSAQLAFDHMFLLLGIVFVFTLPLLLLLKVPREVFRKKKEPGEVHFVEA